VQDDHSRTADPVKYSAQIPKAALVQPKERGESAVQCSTLLFTFPSQSNEVSMRTILMAAVALGTPLSALAADVPAASKIDAVTVFPAGAEVTRSAKVKLVAGEHTIILTDLPPSASKGAPPVASK
jgi:hypothetical protein